MKRTVLTLLATLAVALMMALSTAVALAGWEYEDCPPAAQAAEDHASDRALHNWDAFIDPPANDHAWKENNPGKQ